MLTTFALAGRKSVYNVFRENPKIQRYVKKCYYILKIKFSCQ